MPIRPWTREQAIAASAKGREAKRIKREERKALLGNIPALVRSASSPESIPIICDRACQILANMDLRSVQAERLSRTIKNLEEAKAIILKSQGRSTGARGQGGSQSPVVQAGPIGEAPAPAAPAPAPSPSTVPAVTPPDSDEEDPSVALSPD
jgi:hypothetical protein